MPGIVQIRLAGFGGQGIVLAGALLGHAAVIDGHRVSGSNSYGAQARGSACTAEVVLSEGPIDFPHVLEVDVFVAMSQGAYERYVADIKDEGLVIYDSQLVDPIRPGGRQRPIGATEMAIRELGNKQVANTIMLGSLVAMTGIVSRRSMETAISEDLPPRFREINLKALARGYVLGASSR